MDIVICQNCGAKVIPTAAGECPSCREAIHTPPPTIGRPISSAPPVVMPPPNAVDFSDEASIFETDNPYAAPKITAEPRSRIWDSKPPPNRTLGWALFGFRGRIPRRTYWGLTIGAYIAYYMGFGVLAVLEEDVNNDAVFIAVIPIFIAFIWAIVAVQVKRWHDRNKSGFWFLINFVPLVGPLVTFVECGCCRGTFGHNEYGPDPT